MSKTMAFSPWWRAAAVSLLLLSFIIALSACGAETEVAIAPTEAAISEAAPTSAPTEPPEPTSPPTEPPVPTDPPTEPPPTDTPEPTEEPTPEVIDDSGCITCHMDDEVLKALAVEPEELEELSEGEG